MAAVWLSGFVTLTFMVMPEVKGAFVPVMVMISEVWLASRITVVFETEIVMIGVELLPGEQEDLCKACELCTATCKYP